MSSRRRRRKALIDHFIACTLEESTFPQKHGNKSFVAQAAEVAQHEDAMKPEAAQAEARPPKAVTTE